MELTGSYLRVLPESVRARYEIRETRNAAAILSVTNPGEFAELIDALDGFALLVEDLVSTGGNESKLAARLNDRFRAAGWREGRVDTRVISELRVLPYRPAGERQPTLRRSEVFNEGYKVDNVKGRVALDVEWNAKDGNLDRDIGAYRALYDAGLIDCAVVVTRTQSDLRPLAIELARRAGLSDHEANKRLQTTTTTNLEKLQPRMTRGDAGGCPVLAIAISARCLDSGSGHDKMQDPLCSTGSTLFDTDELGRMIKG
ncbi:MAG TPA: BglII/BstYI family type II restriction endonuclease [Pseudonocardia sp.]